MTDLPIIQGKTFQRVIRWEAPPIIYKPITSISATAPVIVTAPGHGAPDGWRVTVVSAQGMTEINAQSVPPKARDYHSATVLTTDTVELNDVNASEYTPYVSGGYLQYNTPVNLAGFTPRMKIKDRVGGTVLASTEAGDTPLDVIDIAVDNVAKTITLTIPAADTAAFTWKRGVYDLEMVSGTTVKIILSGAVTVTPEVTT